MSKEIAKKKDKEVDLVELDMGDWGEQEMSAKDYIISKILPMQGLSAMVADRKAQIGEYRDSVSGDLLGSIDAPMEFIPFHVERLWIIQKRVGGRFEYQGMEPITRANEDRKWEMEVDGETMRYDWNFMFYVLLPKDVEAGKPTPYILSFRRTSVRSGKKLMTRMFIQNKQEGLTPAGRVISLEGKMSSNDKGTFVTLDISSGRKTTNKEVKEALEMYKMVKTGDSKVDHSDIPGAAKKEDKGNYANDNVEF